MLAKETVSLLEFISLFLLQKATEKEYILSCPPEFQFTYIH